MKKHNIYAKIGLKALRRARKKIAENAVKNNYMIPIWKNGQIEYEIPRVVTEPHSAPDAKSEGVNKA